MASTKIPNINGSTAVLLDAVKTVSSQKQIYKSRDNVLLYDAIVDSLMNKVDASDEYHKNLLNKIADGILGRINSLLIEKQKDGSLPSLEDITDAVSTGSSSTSSSTSSILSADVIKNIASAIIEQLISGKRLQDLISAIKDITGESIEKLNSFADEYAENTEQSLQTSAEDRKTLVKTASDSILTMMNNVFGKNFSTEIKGIATQVASFGKILDTVLPTNITTPIKKIFKEFGNKVLDTVMLIYKKIRRFFFIRLLFVLTKAFLHPTQLMKDIMKISKFMLKTLIFIPKMLIKFTAKFLKWAAEMLLIGTKILLQFALFAAKITIALALATAKLMAFIVIQLLANPIAILTLAVIGIVWWAAMKLKAMFDEWGGIDGFFENLWTSFKDFGYIVWETLKGWMIDSWEWMKDFGEFLWRKLKEFGQFLYDQYIKPVVMTAKSIWKEAIKPAIEKIKEFGQMLKEKLWLPVMQFGSFDGEHWWDKLTNFFGGFKLQKYYPFLDQFVDWGKQPAITTANEQFEVKPVPGPTLQTAQQIQGIQNIQNYSTDFDTSGITTGFDTIMNGNAMTQDQLRQIQTSSDGKFKTLVDLITNKQMGVMPVPVPNGQVTNQAIKDN